MSVDDSDGSDSDDEPEPLKELQDGRDNESEGHSSSEDEKAFVNPLSKKKKTIDAKGEVSEGEWSDENEPNVKDKKNNKKN
jgi:hypothetical protein